MRITIPMLGALLMLSVPSLALAGSHNPCNPCAMKQNANPCSMEKTWDNPCSMKKNPCSMKKMNPCSMHKANPCSMKNANPCAMKNANPCNPCSMSKAKDGAWGTPGNTAIREHAFDNYQQAVDAGKKLWNDETLGKSGMSCASCHSDYALLNLEKNQNYPHFVGMVGDVVSLDQMINYCMLNPIQGEEFAQNSKDLTALGAYFRAYRMQFLREKH